MRRLVYEFMGALCACFLGVGVLVLFFGLLLGGWILSRLSDKRATG